MNPKDVRPRPLQLGLIVAEAFVGIGMIAAVLIAHWAM